MAVDSSDRVLVADAFNARIQEFTATGTFLTKWGTVGNGNGQFNTPMAVAADGANVYVTDTGNDRIQKFGAGSGDVTDPTVTMVTPPNGATYARDQIVNASYTCADEPGGSGLASCIGTVPNGTPLATATAGAHDFTVTATDNAGNSTQVTRSYQVSEAQAPPPFVTAWGTVGINPGQLGGPTDLAVGPDGGVYVADTFNHRVQVFSPSGTLLDAWGGRGAGAGQFEYPRGIAANDATGSVYVADTENHRIQRFDSDGEFDGAWGGFGSANGKFTYPIGVAVAGDGHVYVTDDYGVQEFAANGVFVTRWGSVGTGEGQFRFPTGVEVGPDSHVFVADTGNNRVQEYTAGGTLVATLGTAGTGNGQFQAPVGVAVDDDGTLYVGDSGNSRIQAFTASNAFRTSWGADGAAAGEFNDPGGVDIDAAGRVVVADTGNNRIEIFGPPLAAARPDGRIRKGTTGTLVGNDIYNATGAGQTRSNSVARLATAVYVVSVQNDAPFPDALRLKGSGSTTRFRVKYSVNGAGITRRVTDGTYTTPVLAPGATFTVRVEVTVLAGTPVGASLSSTLVTKSDSEPTRKDTVKFVTSRR